MTAEQWATKYRALLTRLFAVFRETGQWPQVDIVQRDLDRGGVDIDVNDAFAEMPRLPGEQWALHSASASVPLRLLRFLAEASPYLEACLAIATRAVAVYYSDADPAFV